MDSNGHGMIKIVSSLTRSGSSRGQSDSCVNSIRMALEDAGYRLGGDVLVYEDLNGGSEETGAWDPEAEAANARYAAQDENVLAYIGPLDADSAPVSMPILNEAGPLLMVSPCASYPGLTKPVDGRPEEPDVFFPTGRRHFIRTAMSDDLQGLAGAQWVADLGLPAVYVVHDDEPYGRGVAEAFATACHRLGISVVVEPHPMTPAPAAPSYRELASQIAASGAELVYYGGRIQNGPAQLWRDLLEAKPGIARMGADGLFERAFLTMVGEAGEGTLITFGGVPPSMLSGDGAEFYRRYRQRFGIEPEAYAASSFDACNLVLEAIRRAGSRDRAAIVEAAFAVRDHRGALGTWSVLERGDITQSSTSRIRIANGEFDFLGTRELASAAAGA